MYVVCWFISFHNLCLFVCVGRIHRLETEINKYIHPHMMLWSSPAASATSVGIINLYLLILLLKFIIIIWSGSARIGSAVGAAGCCSSSYSSSSSSSSNRSPTSRSRRRGLCWRTCSPGRRAHRWVPCMVACAGCSTQPDLVAIRGAVRRAKCMAEEEEGKSIRF